MDGGTGVVFGIERVDAKRVCACASIERGVEAKVEFQVGTWRKRVSDSSRMSHPSVIHLPRVSAWVPQAQNVAHH